MLGKWSYLCVYQNLLKLGFISLATIQKSPKTRVRAYARTLVFGLILVVIY
jgi:hypothetical protein